MLLLASGLSSAILCFDLENKLEMWFSGSGEGRIAARGRAGFARLRAGADGAMVSARSTSIFPGDIT